MSLNVVINRLRKPARSLATLIVTPLLLGGCMSIKPEIYAGTEPELRLEEYLNGPVTAWGIVQDRSGKVLRRFEVDMVGEWQGDSGTLHETFRYDDGEESLRIWSIKKVSDTRYSGSADDVVGAASGIRSGNAVNWSYVLALEVQGRTWNITFDDWMYLLDERTLVNRATMRKFGFRVGEVLLFFRKEEA
ncbi:MAG: DUF3833 domain-containing protein [Gammaproteobacteria bacterium]